MLAHGLPLEVVFGRSIAWGLFKHSKNMLNSTGAHTNMIQGMWFHVKNACGRKGEGKLK